ncbi:MAG: hypothetical protein L0Z50_23390 [Verrucomicrobiales bacterium]|nr:hypothetical protein [Verrucomicrobiales bacterium]
MRANRKTQSAAARFGPAVKAFLLCSLIAGVGIGYVNQKNSIHLLSDQMRKLEIQWERQRQHRQILLRKLAALNAPTELEAQAQRMNLDLSPTPPDRIVRLSIGFAGPDRRNEMLFAEKIVSGPTRR